MSVCAECGMEVAADVYHPYAACLMFKGCGDGKTVSANLDAVIGHGAQYTSGFDNLADLIHHLRYCRECGETDVMNCAEGKPLWLACFANDAGDVHD